MIQRIQSLYLLLTTLLSILFLKGSLLSFINNTGSIIGITFRGIVKNTGGQGYELITNIIPFSIIVVLVPVLSLITIFFFRKRNVQLKLSGLLIILVSSLILISAYYSYFIISKFNGAIIPGIKMALPFLLLIFSILAYSAIKKDDRIVKSYDRLR